MLQISKESMHGVEAEFMLIVKGSFYIPNPPHWENREVGGEGDITPLVEIF